MALDEFIVSARADISQAQQQLRLLRENIAQATQPREVLNFSRQMNAISRSMLNQQRTLSSAIRDRNSEMRSSASSLQGTFDFGNVSSGFMSVANSIQGIIDKFNILDDIASYAFQKMIDFAKNFVKSGFDFSNEAEQNTIAFETLLGSASKANKLMSDLQTMAAKTPFEFPELAKSTKQLLAMGFSLEAIPWTLKNLGDAAAGTGLGAEGLNRITKAITQMKAKGKISAEEMTGQLGEIVPAWDILSKKMGKSVAEVMDMAQKGSLDVNKSLELLIEGFGEKFPGLMEKLSKTWDGLTSTIRDNLAQISAMAQEKFRQIAKSVLNTIAESTSYMLDVFKQTGDGILAIKSTILKIFGKDIFMAIAPYIEGLKNIFNALKISGTIVFQNLGKIIFSVIDKLGPIFLYASDVILRLSNAFSNLDPRIQSIVTIFGVLASVFISLLPAIITIAGGIAGIVTAALAFSEILLPVIAVILAVTEYLFAFGIAIAVFAGLFVLAWQHIQGFKENVKSAFSEILARLSVIFQNIKVVFEQLINGIITGFKIILPIVTLIFSKVFLFILEVINNLLTTFQGFTDILAGVFTGNWAKIWNGVKTIFASIFNQILNIGSKAINALIGLVNTGIGALNKLKAPDWMPGVGGKGISMPKIPELNYTAIKLDTGDYTAEGIPISKLGKLTGGLSKVKDALSGISNFKLPDLSFKDVDTSKPKKLFDNLSKGLDDTGKKLKKSGNEAQDTLDKTTSKVANFVKSVQDQAKSILEFGGLFEDVVEKKFSGEKLIRAIKSQLSYLDKWKQSLVSLGDRIGTSSALYQQLLSMGPSAGGQIQALSTLTDAKLQEYIGLFGEKKALSYEMGYEMEAGKFQQELYNKQFVFNITGNTITDDLDIDSIANKIISKLRLEGIY